MKKNNQPLIIGAVILIVGALVVANYTGIINIGLQSGVTTDNKTYVGDSSASVLNGKTILSGRGELTAQTDYLSTWLNSGVGEKIIITPHADLWNNWWNGYIGGGAFNQPGALVGRYWITATLTDASGAHSIIWVDQNGRGGFDASYIEVAIDSPTGPSSVGQAIYNLFGDFGKRPWGGLWGQYKKVGWGGVGSTDAPTQTDGWDKWWANPTRSSYSQYEGGLTGTSVAFYFKAGTQGTVNVKVFADYATWHQTAVNSAHYDIHEGCLLQSDNFTIKSSVGDIDVANSNVYSYNGSAEAGGTKETYTKYVFQEGKEVTLNLDTDASRVGKGWKVQVFKPGDVLFVEVPLSDNLENKTVKFTIPDKSFVKGGNNEWKVKLVNPALQVSPTDITPQAEIKLFVVDTYEHAPSGATLTVSPSTVTEGKQVTIVCVAYRNELTKAPITSFRIWAKWKSITNGVYVFDTSIPQSSITQSSGGSTFTGTYTYTASPSYLGNMIYVQAHAQDSGGYTGAEGLGQFSITAQPTAEVVFTVLDNVTGLPISMANVWFNNVKKPSHTDGTATFDVTSGQYLLSVDKTDYLSYPNTLLVIGGDIQKTIRLQPISGGGDGGDGGGGGDGGDGGGGTGNEYKLTIEVWDGATGYDLVSGATVTVGTKTNTTNSFGIAEFTFSESEIGTFDLTATASGYEETKDIVTIPSDLFKMIYVFATGTDEGGEDGGGEDGGGEDGGGTEQPSGIIFTVQVVDDATSSPISNAFVELGDKSKWTTGGSATFAFSETGTGSLMVIAEGYADYTKETVFITDGGMETVRMTVNPSGEPGDDEETEDPDDTTPVDQKYDVTVKVTNGDATTAVMIMNPHGILSMRKFGSDVTFKVSAGTWELQVSKPGYNLSKSTMTIPSKLDYSVTLAKPGVVNVGPQNIPGFEIIAFIGAIGIAMVLLRRRKK